MDVDKKTADEDAAELADLLKKGETDPEEKEKAEHKRLMMVPQNREEVLAQMIVVQDHVKLVSAFVSCAWAFCRALATACRVF